MLRAMRSRMVGVGCLVGLGAVVVILGFERVVVEVGGGL